MTTSDTTPVLIVGGGPVGLVLAIDLAWRGVPCMLVNTGDTTARHPQGSTHNCRSMEPVSYTHLTLPTIYSV